jgi:hypothetical protein
MTLQIARALTESLAALGHLTSIELVFACLGLAIEVTPLAALRTLAPRRPPVAEPRTEYHEAA